MATGVRPLTVARGNGAAIGPLFAAWVVGVVVGITVADASVGRLSTAA
jgi:hypothetical protein